MQVDAGHMQLHHERKIFMSFYKRSLGHSFRNFIVNLKTTQRLYMDVPEIFITIVREFESRNKTKRELSKLNDG